MNKATLVIALAILCATSVQAQGTTNGTVPHAKDHGCMQMSDSLMTMLSLTPEQTELVKESDARCVAACAKVEGQKEPAMDHAAMTAHDTDMKEILTAEQYVKWNAHCTMSKADKGTEKPMGDPMRN